jgi:hypothetical protein
MGGLSMRRKPAARCGRRAPRLVLHLDVFRKSIRAAGRFGVLVAPLGKKDGAIS